MIRRHHLLGPIPVISATARSISSPPEASITLRPAENLSARCLSTRVILRLFSLADIGYKRIVMSFPTFPVSELVHQELNCNRRPSLVDTPFHSAPNTGFAASQVVVLHIVPEGVLVPRSRFLGVSTMFRPGCSKSTFGSDKAKVGKSIQHLGKNSPPDRHSGVGFMDVHRMRVERHLLRGMSCCPMHPLTITTWKIDTYILIIEFTAKWSNMPEEKSHIASHLGQL